MRSIPFPRRARSSPEVIRTLLPALSCRSIFPTMPGSCAAASVRRTSGASAGNSGRRSIGIPTMPMKLCRKSSPVEWKGL